MARSIGLTDGRETTAYRAVMEWRTPEEAVRRDYAGLYDTPGAARGLVTRELSRWARHLVDHPEEECTFDAWAEPVTVTNHPGKPVDGAEPVTPAQRLTAIERIANALTDSLCGDEWHVTEAIRDIAAGRMTPAEAYEFLGSEWREEGE
jgi:hypothetical protein